MRLAIGVMGTATNDESFGIRQAAYCLGKNIVGQGFVIITGACPGHPSVQLVDMKQKIGR